MPGKITNAGLADNGRVEYEWALRRMGLIEKLKSRNERGQPLAGMQLGFCLHITKETAVLAMAAKSLGAEVAICSANPLSVQDHIAAFLYDQGLHVYSWRGESIAQYQQCIRSVLALKPVIVTDDGGDLHIAAHKKKAKGILGGTEETTSGVKRLAALENTGKLLYPIIAVNNAHTKYLFDNRHGTGQSTLDGILRATGMLLAGKNVLVCGYGWVGKGVASRARGMGAIVTVSEVNPVRALEAKMDGFAVSRLSDAASISDVFITCTGQIGVIREEHFLKMKDRAVVANAGHFDVEIDIDALQSMGRATQIRPNVDCFTINGKRLFLLSKGRVVNLIAAEGNPPEVMALSFANQLLSILHIAKSYKKMERKVYAVPEKINNLVARHALDFMNLRIDKLTKQQKLYQTSS